VTSVQELIALARARPGKLNYSSAGIGTPPHLIGEMFKQRLGLDVVHVPYKGGGLSTQAVVAGETQFSFENPAASLPLVQAGNVRGLASTSETRGAQTPDLPTMIEAGVPDYVVTSFFGVVAPAGTPAPVIARLNAVINEALRTEPVQAALKKLGAEPTIESPEEFTRFIAAEMRKWTEIAAIAGIKAD
jgi:tripartite-type tricarboxylate transporter receptor subunit TctC